MSSGRSASFRDLLYRLGVLRELAFGGRGIDTVDAVHTIALFAARARAHLQNPSACRSPAPGQPARLFYLMTTR